MSSKLSSRPPLGIIINPSASANFQWRVGAEVGDGACGTVHDLEPVASGAGNKRERFVIKMCPLPLTTQTKSKRKKKSQEERFAMLLSHENNLYRNHLSFMRGSMIPEIPLPIYGEKSQMEPQGYGEIKGYRYLVMERMAAPLSSFPGYLMSQKSLHSQSVMGGLAVRMMDCLEALHGKNFVFVDVKMDNFMFRDALTRGAKLTSIQVVDSLRLIDLGLVEKLFSAVDGGHREDEYPNSQMRGTPTYASINVHQGHTPSKRDDCEALGYVVADLLLRIAGNKSSEPDSCSLPWRNGKTDEEILQMKVSAVESNDLYKGMGRHDANVLREYVVRVRDLRYAQTPDYQELKRLLRKLRGEVFVHKDDALRSGEKASGVKRRATKRTCGATSGPSTPAMGARKSARKKNISPEIVVVESESDNDGDEEEEAEFYDAQEDHSYGTVSMEWEPEDEDDDEEENVAKGNGEVQALTGRKKPQSTKKPSLKLLCVDGPGKGTAIALLANTTVTLGSDPGSKRTTRSRDGTKASTTTTNIAFPISFDNKVSANHVKLDVYCKRKVKSVKVRDLRSSAGTFVNGQKLASGGYRQAFRGDKILIGRSTFVIDTA